MVYIAKCISQSMHVAIHYMIVYLEIGINPLMKIHGLLIILLCSYRIHTSKYRLLAFLHALIHTHPNFTHSLTHSLTTSALPHNLSSKEHQHQAAASAEEEEEIQPHQRD